MTSYIHYGNDHFDMDLFEHRKNSRSKTPSMLNEPPFGFWACRTDNDFDWKHWCEYADFHTDRLNKSFIFTLSESAKVLTVRNPHDIEPFLTDGPFGFGEVIDFEKIMLKYDALDLIRGDNYMDLHDWFSSWDADSIVIWNPYIIEPRKDQRLYKRFLCRKYLSSFHES